MFFFPENLFCYSGIFLTDSKIVLIPCFLDAREQSVPRRWVVAIATEPPLNRTKTIAVMSDFNINHIHVCNM